MRVRYDKDEDILIPEERLSSPLENDGVLYKEIKGQFVYFDAYDALMGVICDSDFEEGFCASPADHFHEGARVMPINTHFRINVVHR